MDDIINELCKIWYDDELFSKEMTIKLFECKGLSINSNEKENDLVKKNDILCEEIY